MHLLSRRIKGHFLVCKQNICSLTCTLASDIRQQHVDNKTEKCYFIDCRCRGRVLICHRQRSYSFEHTFSPVWRCSCTSTCTPVNCITGWMAKVGWLQNHLFQHWNFFTCQVTWRPSLCLEYLRYLSLCISSELPSSSNGSAAKENSGVASCDFGVYAYICSIGLPQWSLQEVFWCECNRYRSVQEDACKALL